MFPEPGVFMPLSKPCDQGEWLGRRPLLQEEETRVLAGDTPRDRLAGGELAGQVATGGAQSASGRHSLRHERCKRIKLQNSWARSLSRHLRAGRVSQGTPRWLACVDQEICAYQGDFTLQLHLPTAPELLTGNAHASSM